MALSATSQGMGKATQGLDCSAHRNQTGPNPESPAQQGSEACTVCSSWPARGSSLVSSDRQFAVNGGRGVWSLEHAGHMAYDVPIYLLSTLQRTQGLPFCICTCAIDARTLIWTGLSTFIIRACQCTCLLPVKATPLVESHGYFPEVSATALATKMFLWLATPPTDLVLIGLFHQTIILDVYFGWESTARIKVQRPEHCTS